MFVKVLPIRHKSKAMRKSTARMASIGVNDVFGQFAL